MKVVEVSFPTASVLYAKDFDYVDSYRGSYADKKNKISVTDIGKAFFTSAPKWTARLFYLRNKLVSIFGLKIPGKMKSKQKSFDDFKFEPNQSLGLFRVYNKSENEIILGESESFISSRLSLSISLLCQLCYRE